MFNQYFETTVVGAGDNRAFRFIVIPSSQMDRQLRPLFESQSAKLWRSQAYPPIDIELTDGLHFPEGDPEHGIQAHMQLLPYMLAAMGCYPLGNRALEYFKKVKFEGHTEPPDGDIALLKLTSRLVTAPVIPISQSPLELSSLTGIINSGSGVGIGATVGFLVGWGTPYLLVTVPAGMLICAAAAGIAKAMDKGFERKLLEWIGASDPHDRP